MILKDIYSQDIRQDMDLVDDYIRRALRTDQPLLYKAIKELLEAGGKHLRPLLVILSSKFGYCSRHEAARLAAIVEILHMATLIHDDIIDDSPMRRGVPTVQARWGKDVAVFTGDFLFSTVFSLLSEGASFQDLRLVSRTIKRLCEGEVDQYQARHDMEGTVIAYLKRIRRKTADMFALSCAIGARQAGCSKNIYIALKNFGLNFGMVFQITDDILDFTGDEHVMGKPTGTDFEEGVYTLPLLYAMRSVYRDELLYILNQRNYTADDVNMIKYIVKVSGGIAQARKLATRFMSKASSNLEILPANAYRNLLYKLLNDVIDRSY